MCVVCAFLILTNIRKIIILFWAIEISFKYLVIVEKQTERKKTRILLTLIYTQKHKGNAAISCCFSIIIDWSRGGWNRTKAPRKHLVSSLNIKVKHTHEHKHKYFEIYCKASDMWTWLWEMYKEIASNWANSSRASKNIQWNFLFARLPPCDKAKEKLRRRAKILRIEY